MKWTNLWPQYRWLLRLSDAGCFGKPFSFWCVTSILDGTEMTTPTREQVKELELKVARLDGIIETLMKQQQPLHVYGPVTQQRQFDWPVQPFDPFNPCKVTCDASKIHINESDCDGGSRAGWENES